jgi:hypothetical protein
MYTSVWRLPSIPDSWRLPDGVRPAKFGGRYLLTSAWADYQEGGVLQYREFICSLMCRRGLRTVLTVVMCWVDSDVSLRGGRELWGIPKELGAFELRHKPTLNAVLRPADGSGALAATGRRGLRFPGRWTVPGRFVQQIGGQPRPVRQRIRGRLRRAKLNFTAPADGPLAVFAGRQPMTSLVISDFDFAFGSAADELTAAPADLGATSDHR